MSEEFNKKDKMFGREIKTVDIFLENQILMDVALDLKKSLAYCALIIGAYDKCIFNSPEEEKEWIEIVTNGKNTLQKYKNIREYVKSEVEKINELRK